MAVPAYGSFITPTMGVAMIALAILIVLVILEVYNSRHLHTLSAPLYEEQLKQARAEAERLVAEAHKRAVDISAAAEAASARAVEARADVGQEAKRQYEESLRGMLDQLAATLKASAEEAARAEQRETTALLESLKSQGEAMREHLSQIYQALQLENAKKIDAHLVKSFETADTESATYERARKQSVDSRIVEIVTKTVEIVLRKDLSADVSADLVLSALEEAKVNNIF